MAEAVWYRRLADAPIEIRPDDHDDDDAGVPEVMRAGQAIAAAAVLIVISADAAPMILLTRRSAHLSKHAGQISFPGGRVDESDADFAAAALREAYEEIGLERDDVTLCGYLPDMLTGTGYRITPVVARSHLGMAQMKEVLRANPDEVAEVIYAPLSLLLAAKNYDSFLRQDGDVSWRSWRVTYQDYVIWGATAAILHQWAIGVSSAD